MFGNGTTLFSYVNVLRVYPYTTRAHTGVHEPLARRTSQRVGKTKTHAATELVSRCSPDSADPMALAEAGSRSTLFGGDSADRAHGAHRGQLLSVPSQAVTSCRPQHPTQTSCSLTIRRGSSCVYQRRHSSRQFCRRFTIARKLGSGLYH